MGLECTGLQPWTWLASAEFMNSARQLRWTTTFPCLTRSTKNTVAGSTGDAALLAVHGEPRRIRRARTVWPRQSRRQMAVTVTQWPRIFESIRAWSVAEPLLLDVGRVTVLHWKCTDYLDTRERMCFRCKPRKRAELWEAADSKIFCILALRIKTTLASRSIVSIPPVPKIRVL